MIHSWQITGLSGCLSHCSEVWVVRISIQFASLSTGALECAPLGLESVSFSLWAHTGGDTQQVRSLWSPHLPSGNSSWVCGKRDGVPASGPPAPSPGISESQNIGHCLSLLLMPYPHPPPKKNLWKLTESSESDLLLQNLVQNKVSFRVKK